ncbi:hypothetical protein M8J77_001044 [Diaphorina citri]|nr:hypothetical protein M8J77_001044 [Diaphorina citri]
MSHCDTPTMDKTEVYNSPGCGYNSLLDKMKRSVYNTICWNPVDSETELRAPQDAKPREFLCGTEVIRNCVRKCGDYLSPKRRTKSKKKAQADAKRQDCLQPCNSHRQRSGFGDRNDRKVAHDTEKRRKENFNAELDADKYEEPRGRIVRYRDRECKPCGPNVEPCKTLDKTCKGIDSQHDKNCKAKPCEAKCNEKAHKEGQTNAVHRHNCGDVTTRRNQKPKQSKLSQLVKYKYRGKSKRCKQIYELSDQQCRNFKEKGYVKVNVKVKPNVSVSDFDIVIRRDKVKTGQGKC